MMGGTKHRLRSSVIVSMVLAIGAPPALADGARDAEPQGGAPGDASASPTSPSAVTHERARALFDRGKVHYALGEYDEAITLFREAYELTSAPTLLFNIAQAHRLKGDCPHAVEVYRHFVRISPGAPLAAEARTHIDTLSSTCAAEHRDQPIPAAPPTTPDQPPVRPAPLLAVPQKGETSTPPRDDQRSRRSIVTRSLLIGGLGLAAGTGALALWNNHRHDKWSAEDSQLRMDPQAGTDPGAWAARQDRNDALLRSIWRTDIVTGILAGLSAASVIASAVMGQLPDRGVQASLGPNEVRVAWLFRWP